MTEPNGASMARTDGAAVTVLDDGVFHVHLACGFPAGVEPGYLRRVAGRDGEPADCIGCFEPEPGGRWRARVYVPFDDASNSDSETVASGVERMTAIVALWKARHRAFSLC